MCTLQTLKSAKEPITLEIFLAIVSRISRKIVKYFCLLRMIALLLSFFRKCSPNKKMILLSDMNNDNVRTVLIID